MASILVISQREEDVRLINLSLPAACHAETADDLDRAVEFHRKHLFDLVFLDLNMLKGDLSPKSHSEIIDHFRKLNPLVAIVILSSKETIRETVNLIKAGADDYLIYPVRKEEVRLVIDSLRESVTQNLELDYLRDQFWRSEWLETVQTHTDSMRAVYKKIRAVAPTKATVLLSGETGTGKSLLARILHRHSNRSDEPFISVHCGAIPETLIESELFGHEKGAFTGAVRRKIGKFEMARNGTIFLDEIGTLTSGAQVKLLQVLQDGTFNRVGGDAELQVDVRVIAATNSDLSAMSERGEFRNDLFYRLNVFPIEVTALRERRADIAHFVDQFLKKLNALYGKNIRGVHPTVVKALQSYHWPGNIRELENLMERAYILESTPILTPDNFPSEIISSESTATLPLDANLPLAAARQKATEDFERHYLNELFAVTKGRVNQAAKQAGISTRQLNKLMVKHGIRKETFKN